MSTLKDERSIQRELFELARGFSAEPRFARQRWAQLISRGVVLIAKLRQERTNARCDADRLQGINNTFADTIRRQANAENRLRQERDAYANDDKSLRKQLSEASKALVVFRRNRAAYKAEVLMLTQNCAAYKAHAEDCKADYETLEERAVKSDKERDAWKADRDKTRTISDAASRRVCMKLDRALEERDAYRAEVARRARDCERLEKRAVKSAKRIERCLRTMRNLDSENGELQEDRDATFKRLTSAYATCEKLRYQLEEGADVETDAHDADVDKFNADVDKFNADVDKFNAGVDGR